MSTNLWEFKNQFKLIDVEGIVLSVGEELLIREPNGFGDSMITLSRSEKTHGFDFEFTEAEVPYGFTRAMKLGSIDPFTFLSSLYNLKGVDAKCEFQFLNFNTDTLLYEVQYDSMLDFSEIECLDFKVEILARRINFDDKFRTRQETPVSFDATTSIDGDPITGLFFDQKSMFLHGKLIRQNAESFSLPFNSNISFRDLYLQNRFDGIEFENGDKPYIDSPAIIEEIAGTSSEVIPRGSYALNSPDNILRYTAKVTLTYSGFVESAALTTVIVSVGYATKNFSDPGAAISDFDITILDTFVSAMPGDDVSFSGSHTFNIELSSADPEGTNLHAYILRTNNSPVFSQLHQIFNFGLDVEIETVRKGSTVTCYNLFDSTRHIIESLTGQILPLESDFLSNEAIDIYQTNGYKIRSIGSESVVTSFKDQFQKFLQPMFGLGYAVVEDNGEFKVRIERYEYFYQNKEIIYLDNLQNDTYEATAYEEILVNNVVVGYKEFPKSTDENKNNNVDEFNTKHDLLFPLEAVDKKKEYICNAITSGYKIENQRREQFKLTPNTTVSDDPDIFAINGIESDNYEDQEIVFLALGLNYIVFINSSLDIRKGDVLTIPSSVSNAGPHTVLDSFILGVNLVAAADSTIIGEVVVSDVIRDTTRLRALRDEEFQSVSNVLDVNTVYNLGFNPRYLLLNQSPVLNSGMDPKPGTDEVSVRDVQLNSAMTCQFKPGEGGYILGGDDNLVDMGGDVPLSDLNGYQKLFKPNRYKFTANLDYSDVLIIRDAYLNQSLDDINYGFIRFKCPDGTDKKGFLMEMKYNPLSEQTEFELIEKFE